MRLAATARTTISSLKPHRSSRLPPPRATMRMSGRAKRPPGRNALKPAIAAATSAAQVSPCTRTGHTMTRVGKRSLNPCSMSRMTAPVGEVMMPTRRGRYGRGFLRVSSNRPSAANLRLRSSMSAISAPTPAGSRLSMTIWYLEEPGYVVTRPCTTTSIPSSGFTLRRAQVVFQTTASILALSSLRPK